jgi:hypothetical protein
MFSGSPEAVADAWSKPPGPAPSLFRGVLCHTDRFQSGQTSAWIESRQAEQAGIDHNAYALDRQARFGDRRRQYDLAHAGLRWRDRAILRLLREIAMEWCDHHSRTKVGIEEFPFDSPDFRHSRKKNQKAAVVTCEGLPNDSLDGDIQRT